jgi:hypothetical protein
MGWEERIPHKCYLRPIIVQVVISTCSDANLGFGFVLGFFVCVVGLVFELGASHLPSRHSTIRATPPVHFGDEVSQTICLGWSPARMLQSQPLK